MTNDDVRNRRHVAPFFDPAHLLLGKLPEHLAKCFRRLPYNTFRRHFGINTTWYLHSHFEWLKLSNLFIQFLLEVCLRLTTRSLWVDSRKCHTSTASPAEPGELPSD